MLSTHPYIWAEWKIDFKSKKWDKMQSALEMDKFMVWEHPEAIYEEARQ